MKTYPAVRGWGGTHTCGGHSPRADTAAPSACRTAARSALVSAAACTPAPAATSESPAAATTSRSNVATAAASSCAPSTVSGCDATVLGVLAMLGVLPSAVSDLLRPDGDATWRCCCARQPRHACHTVSAIASGMHEPWAMRARNDISTERSTGNAVRLRSWTAGRAYVPATMERALSDAVRMCSMSCGAAASYSGPECSSRLAKPQTVVARWRGLKVEMWPQAAAGSWMAGSGRSMRITMAASGACISRFHYRARGSSPLPACTGQHTRPAMGPLLG